MKRLLFVAGLLALAATAVLADGLSVNSTNTIINGANTWSALQTFNGGINLDAATAPDLSDQKGTAQNLFGICCSDPVIAAQFWNLSNGTNAVPITANGPVVKISRTRNFPGTNCGSNPTNSDCGVALDVAEVCGLTDAINCNGIAGDAVVQSTVGNAANGQGGVFRCDMVGSSGNVASAWCEGAYLLGRADGAFTSGSILAAEISAWNVTGSDGTVSGTTQNGYNGIACAARGSNKDSSCMEIYATGTTPAGWIEGISNKVVGSVQPETSTFIHDYASEPNVFVDGGSHTYGWDANGASYSSFFLRGPSASFTVDGSGNAVSLTEKLTGSLSVAAFSTTTGARVNIDTSAINDTGDTGTVASAYVNKVGASPITSTSAVTFTNMFGTDFEPPTCSGNATCTNLYAARFGGAVNLNGPLTGLGNTSAGGANSFELLNSTPTATVPDIITNRGDTTTGLGGAINHSALIAQSTDVFDCISTGCTGAGTLTTPILSISGSVTATTLGTTSGARINLDTSTVNDSTDTGTVANAYLNKVGATAVTSTSAVTFTNMFGTDFESPTCSGNATCTNIWTARFGGNVNFAAGLQETGGQAFLNANSNFNVSICTGTCNATVSIGGASATLVTSSAPVTMSNATITLSGITTGTNADFLCRTSGGVVLIQTSSCTISSKRFKNLSHKFTGDALAALMKLDVWDFTYKPTKPANPDPNAKHPTIGIMAEDIAKYAPACAIYENDMKTAKSYKPECVIGMLIAGMQKQQREIDALKARKM